MRYYLLEAPPEIIIPPQWCAADIVFEMEQMGLHVPTVLIEHCGSLINFRIDDHPYQYFEGSL